MTIIFKPAFDRTIPPAARDEIRRGRGAGNGCAHTLSEIADILYARGETDRRLGEREVKRIIDSALRKLRSKLNLEEFKVLLGEGDDPKA